MHSYKDRLYLASGYLSGLCIIIIMVVVLAQIIGRLLGFIVPSAEDISGYCLSASIFFGLAYTFRDGGHIRVTLLFQNLPPKARFAQEFFVLIIGLALASFVCWYSWYMIWESYLFEELTQGYIPMPLWAVQIPVGLGSTGLLLAVLDALAAMLGGKLPIYTQHEGEVNLEEI
ncbi:MAG: TRAP transporter small permease [Reinekea forsetii]|jgi:TRAP-type C4-dicarboxylate transport system permease small subunit|nr:TRAP transporter small permease [Reinekea forsetii]MDO7642886.1 TRAP transporter small permease [Reinekea forsetii]MDO7644333.1 TRAP transporter small permease [Reinekea forsetii]MDO7674125.1 TRAP transporter small permease [Reinekea forsetii]|tara:strand:+ start:2526 stop:3044 length:519 start_codon:yes stop_codon:yes gene_type:complete